MPIKSPTSPLNNLSLIPVVNVPDYWVASAQTNMPPKVATEEGLKLKETVQALTQSNIESWFKITVVVTIMVIPQKTIRHSITLLFVAVAA